MWWHNRSLPRTVTVATLLLCTSSYNYSLIALKCHSIQLHIATNQTLNMNAVFSLLKFSLLNSGFRIIVVIHYRKISPSSYVASYLLKIKLVTNTQSDWKNTPYNQSEQIWLLLILFNRHCNKSHPLVKYTYNWSFLNKLKIRLNM